MSTRGASANNFGVQTWENTNANYDVISQRESSEQALMERT